MKMEIRYKINKRVLWLALVGIIMVCSSCLMFVYDPLQLILKKMLALSPGTIFFSLWSSPPYDIVMNLYIFNVTNAEQFLRGEEKLNVSQLGPYSYREILTNNNATFNEDGTVTFTPKREYVFDLDASVGDVNVDRIIALNVPLIGIQSYLKDSSFLTNMGFSMLSNSVHSESFLNLTVYEYLWGYDDELVTVANRFLPNWIDFGKFGIFERLINRDNSNEVTIVADPKKRTSKYKSFFTDEELMSEFHIAEWNGSPGLKEWGYEEQEGGEPLNTAKKCQLVEGAYDGTIFPRHLKKNTTLTLFRKAFCRPVVLDFAEEGYTAQGFRSYNYKLRKDMFYSPEENPSNECYCYKGTCPGKGLQNIAPCYYDIPIVLSQPHFYNAHPEIQEAINGLSPNETEHASIGKLQPDLGVPLDESALKIQVNLGVGKTIMNSKTRPFNGLTIPLFWIDLTCDKLSPLLWLLITMIVSALPIAQEVISYLLLLVGLAMISGAALLTLFFSKSVVPRSLSIGSDYTPVPLIAISSQYLKSELRICK